MVREAHLLRLDVNDSYYYNMNLVEFSDQLWDVYRVDHWMRKYRWWCYLLFWGYGLLLVNAYIIYQTLCEEGKVNSMSHYEFQRLVCLADIEPKCFGGCDHLDSAFQCRDKRKKDGVCNEYHCFVMDGDRK